MPGRGFGLTTAETDRRVRLIERVFKVLDETPVIYPEWCRLVLSHSLMGVQVHDARIVTVMNQPAGSKSGAARARRKLRRRFGGYDCGWC